ncbi:MAG TPA: DUF6356 family protein [Aliidongia sp.]|nr:DUF6356 family protein [Aliidongia sp.]
MFRLFIEHPKSVGETYWQHMAFATRTGTAMMVAGAACMVHAVFPFLCTTTGSRTIRALAARLGGAQPRRAVTVLHFNPMPRSSNGIDRPAAAESLNSAAL